MKKVLCFYGACLGISLAESSISLGSSEQRLMDESAEPSNSPSELVIDALGFLKNNKHYVEKMEEILNLSDRTDSSIDKLYQLTLETVSEQFEPKTCFLAVTCTMRLNRIYLNDAKKLLENTQFILEELRLGSSSG